MPSFPTRRSSDLGVKNKLIAGKENAIISKDLATIHCSVPLDFDFEKTLVTRPDFEKVLPVFIELEFKNLYSRLLNTYDNHGKEEGAVVPEEAIAEPAPFLADAEVFDKKKADYKLITKVKEAEELASNL